MFECGCTSLSPALSFSLSPSGPRPKRSAPDGRFKLRARPIGCASAVGESKRKGRGHFNSARILSRSRTVLPPPPRRRAAGSHKRAQVLPFTAITLTCCLTLSSSSSLRAFHQAHHEKGTHQRRTPAPSEAQRRRAARLINHSAACMQGRSNNNRQASSFSSAFASSLVTKLNLPEALTGAAATRCPLEGRAPKNPILLPARWPPLRMLLIADRNWPSLVPLSAPVAPSAPATREPLSCADLLFFALALPALDFKIRSASGRPTLHDSRVSDYWPRASLLSNR